MALLVFLMLLLLPRNRCGVEEEVVVAVITELPLPVNLIRIDSLPLRLLMLVGCFDFPT